MVLWPEPLGSHRALVWIKFPAVRVIAVLPHAISRKVQGQFAGQSLVVSPHLGSSFFNCAIAAGRTVMQVVELANPLRDTLMRGVALRIWQDSHAIEHHQRRNLIRERA